MREGSPPPYHVSHVTCHIFSYFFWVGGKVVKLGGRGSVIDGATPSSLDNLGRLFINKPAAQAAGQTLHDATPPVGQIHPFSKIAIPLEPIRQFGYCLGFIMSKTSKT